MNDSYNEYFTNRIAGGRLLDGDSKYRALQQASQDKIKELTARKELQLAREAAHAQSLVGKLGLDLDSAAGAATNLAANIYSGASRVAGDVVGFVAADAEAMLRDLAIDEPTKAALGRVQKNQGSPEDIALVNFKKTPNSYSALEHAGFAREARERSARIDSSFDRTSLVEQTNKEGLREDIGKDFQDSWDQVKAGASAFMSGEGIGSAGSRAKGGADLVSGLAKLIFNAGDAAVNNKMGVLEYVAENVPQLAIGLLGKAGQGALLATNAAYASEEYQKGVAKFQNENNGAYPAPEKRAEMAAYAASLALAEQLGDVTTLKAFSKGGSAAADAAKVSFKQSLLNSGKTIGTATATEAATEGYQTFAEGQANLTPATAAQIYEGAVIGGLVGGGMSTGLRTVAEMTGSTPEKVAASIAGQKDVADKKATVALAITTGDVSTLTDPKSKNFAPAQAIAALAGNSQLPGATEEVKAANVVKAEQIITDLESQGTALKEELALRTVDGKKAKLVEYESEIAGLTPESPLFAPLTQMVESLKGALQEAETPESVKRTEADSKAIQARINTLERTTVEAQKNLSALKQVVTTPKDIAALVATINKPFSTDEAVAATELVAKTSAAGRIVSLAMSSPDSVSSDTAAKLANDTSNALTDDQRTYLRKFSEARIARNALMTVSKVTQDIFFGAGNKGIADYQKAFNKAIAASDPVAANKELAGLTKFAADQTQKFNVAVKALAQKPGTVVIKKGNEWVISPTALPSEVIKANGGFRALPGKMLTGMEIGSSALNATLAELQSVYQIKFQKVGTSSVQDEPQQVDKPQESAAGPVASAGVSPAPAASVVGASGSGNLAGTGASAGVPGVGTAPAVAGQRAELNTAIVKKMGDSELKDALDSEMDKPGYQESPLFKQLDSEMTSRETAAAKEVDVSQSEQNKEVAPATSEPVVAEVKKAPTTEVATEAPAGLSILTKKTPKGTPYVGKHLLADYFKQSVEAGKNGKQALLTHKDFLSAWLKKEADIKDFVNIESDRELTGEETSALSHMRSTLVTWNAFLKGNIAAVKLQSEFLSKDMMRFFMEEAGDPASIEENVLTAMSQAGYSWLLRAATAPPYMTKEDINRMHGQQEDGYVSDEGENVLRTVYDYESKAVSDLGRAALRSLNLKPASKKTPLNLLPQLEAAIGTQILIMLEAQGAIKRKSIKNSVLESEYLDINRDTGDPEDSYARVRYVELARVEGKLAPTVETLVEQNKGSFDIVDKVFSKNINPRFASTVPLKFEQKFAKGTEQPLADWQVATIQKTMDTPYQVIPEMLGVMEAIGEDVLIEIAGGIDLDSGHIHVANRKSIEAKNLDLIKQYTLMMEMLRNPNNSKGTLTDFFLSQTIWVNYRGGFNEQSLNPQNSKIHRFSFANSEWRNTLKFGDAARMNDFFLGVAQALGVKIDKALNQTGYSLINKEIKGSPDLKLAIEALTTDGTKYDLLPNEIAAIRNVSVGREGMMTLQALVAYGKYRHARMKVPPVSEVEISMLIGADGKTSGPMLSQVAFGAADTAEELYETINRGGMYSTAPGQEQGFSEYASKPGSRDLYEDLIAFISTVAKEFLDTNRNKKGQFVDKPKAEAFFNVEQWSALETLTKPLMLGEEATSAGRNAVKTPLTGFGFGASLKTSVSAMERDFIEGLNKTLQDISSGKRKDISIDEFWKAVNTVSKLGDPTIEPIEGISIKESLSGEFEEDSVKALLGGFNILLGQASEIGFGNYFSKLIRNRDQFVKSTNASFSIYKIVYDVARINEIERLMNKGDIEFRIGKAGAMAGKRIPSHDMSQEQEQEFSKNFRDLLPVMRSAFSPEGSNAVAGLRMADSSNIDNRTSIYEVTAGFNNQITNSLGALSNKLAVAPFVATDVAPGVKGIAYSIHSIESHAMHKALQAVKGSNNVHDEIGSGVANVLEAAKAINKSIAETLFSYSPQREAFNMLEKQVIELAGMLKAGLISISTVNTLLAAWTDNYNKGVPKKDKIGSDKALYRTVLDSFSTANSIDNVRLEALSKMAVMEQYPWAGSAYKIPQGMRDGAAKALSELPTGLSEALQDAMQVIDAAGKDKGAKTAAPAWSKEVKAKSPFGTLGTNDRSNEAIAGFLESSPVTTASTVIRRLYNFYSNDAALPNREFNMELIKKLVKAIPSDMQIRLITSDTTEEDVLGMPEEKAVHAWFSFGTDKAGTKVQELYVMGREFESSMIQPDVLLHELTHAALARLVDSVEKSTEDTEAKKLLAELELLRLKAKDFDKAGQFAAATKNVQEFIAWGMTNKQFQDEVLMKVTMAPKTLKTGLVSGFTSFIKAITALIFKDKGLSPQATTVNGMKILINNVSGLLNQATSTQTQEQSTKGVQSLAMEAVDNYTTLDIHQALGSARNPISGAFESHLRGLLSGIVTTLHGPFGALHEAVSKDVSGSAFSVWLKALDTGKAPFASSLIASGLEGSPQEDFAAEQVEVTVRAALEGNDTMARTAYGQLTELFTEARARLKPENFYDGDWAAASPTAKQVAQEQYDFVFTLKRGNGGKSDYLSRFAALGLANAKFNTLLKFPSTVKSKAKATTFTGKLESVFLAIIKFFQNKITHTWDGQSADIKMMVLVQQLVSIEANRKEVLRLNADPNNISAIESIEEASTKITDYLRAKTIEIAGSSFVRSSKNGFLKGGAALVRGVAGNRMDEFVDVLAQLKDRELKGHEGVLASLLTEVKGHADRFKAVLLMTKFNEKTRKDIIAQTSKGVLQTFKDGGEYLDKETKAAISAVFLRSGMHHLLGMFSMVELDNLLKDSSAVDKEIAKLEAQLSGKFKQDYLVEAAALGFYNATGIAGIDMLKLNAHNIAFRAGTVFRSSITEADGDAAQALIAPLVALRTLSYLDKAQLTKASQVLQTENERGGENGIEFVLLQHQFMEKEAKERNFSGSATLMQHGYAPEIHNPNIETVIGTLEEVEDLTARGYVNKGELWVDAGDPDKELRFIFTRKGVGQIHYLSGAMSLTSMAAAGSEKHDGYLSTNSLNGMANNVLQSQVMQSRTAAINTVRKPGSVPNFSKGSGRYMVPVFNETGDVVNWRYMMTEANRDTLLERDNNFENILGALAGSIFDKEASSTQNRKVVEALKEQFDSEFATRSESYVAIGPRSTDPELLQLWAMLPKSAKDAVEEVWGPDGMMVRSDSLYIVFGYRKLSLAKMFRIKDLEDKENANRVANGVEPMSKSEVSALQRAFIGLVEGVLTYGAIAAGMPRKKAERFARRAEFYVSKGEGMWQEVVSETKDIIVVKMGVVMLGNIYSNISMLSLNAVPIMDIIKGSAVAIKAATDYQADSQELFRLKSLVDTNYTKGKDKEIEQRIIELENAIARNPARELIEGGLMPNIVEDISADEDKYSYKKALVTMVEGYAQKLPKQVVDATKTVYMSHDGSLYKNLSRITQMSDFVARYVYYQHVTTRKVDPLSKPEAILRASSAFVNYDIPMHPALQYSDDMGITMFTKYFLRIQKELMRLTQENPGRVLSAVLLGQAMELGPIVLDGSFIAHMGNNPVQAGAFKFATVLDDLATVNVGLSLFK